MNRPKIIAVDFDGTLFEDRYPHIGEPIWSTLNKLYAEIEDGARVILWTCRCGKELQNAVDKCAAYEIHFEAINENLPDIIEAFGTDSRKIFANEYWDDKGVHFPIAETSDGYHTFNELYHHRAILFKALCDVYCESAWKSKQHHDGTMYDKMFVVGIDTPMGQATYHYDIEPYWDMFDVKELEKAPEWDGHTPAEALTRISCLATTQDDDVKRIYREYLVYKQRRKEEELPTLSFYEYQRRHDLA